MHILCSRPVRIMAWQSPRELSQNTREVAAAYIAAGVDPKRSIIFNQR